ncbi:HAD family hydrolase [bacterium DOLZORAL124_38_8]|nr:MAG: HAD family hydrolase [bacterium DOLZORAL124_38_8]
MKQKNTQKWYDLSVAEIFKVLASHKSGLTSAEVQKRQVQYGKNKIVLANKIPLWKRLVEPLKDPLALMLLGAAIVSFFVNETETGIVFLVIIGLNVALEFWQSYQSENILKSLEGFIKKTAKVRRDGKIQEILSEELVPGDVVLIEEGDAIPADIRLTDCLRFQVNSFALTGESVPQQKSAQVITGKFSVADQTNMIRMGSMAVTGKAEGIVIATGMDTVFGNVSKLSAVDNGAKTPLQRELANMSKKNFFMALGIMAVMFVLSLFVLEKPLLPTIVFSIVVATSMVPQGLPLEINLSLLLGVVRLGKKNAVVKKLDSVEALGSASIICTDKTGTLTRNEMNIVSAFGHNFSLIIDGVGYHPTGTIQSDNKPITVELNKQLQDFYQALYFNNNARLCEPDKNHTDYYVIGDPTEGALRVMGARVGLDSNMFEQNYTEIDGIPFDSDRKMMSSIYQEKNADVVRVFTKGATESVLQHCTKIRNTKTGKDIKITSTHKKEILKKTENYAKQAYRVLAIAQKVMPKANEFTQDNTESELVYLGSVVMMDLPRTGVAEAFKVSQGAHIKTVMITGDNALTASAIAQKIGLVEPQKGLPFSATGAEVEAMEDTILTQHILDSYACIFSRVSPEQKLRIVTLLRQSGEVVAVTGDGINDAPALKQADIGVSMGKIGTEVAKEASQIVLADDSYSTLVDAIKEGRTIYQNLVKTVKSCYTSNFGELFVILLGILLAGYFSGTEPLKPIQILLIDLLGEMGPLIALTFDPLFKNGMTTPPRNMNDNVLNRHSLTDIIFTGLLMGGTAFAAFALTFWLTQDGKVASTATYIMLIMAQYMNILSRRTNGFMFSEYFFKNKYLWGAMVVTMTIIVGIIYSPIGQLESVGFAPISMKIWGVIALMTAVMLVLVESKKWIFNQIKK